MRGLFFVLFFFLAGCATLPSAETQAKIMEMNRKGVQLIKEEKGQEAEKFFSQALKINPKDGAARNNLGFCYQQKGKFTQAIKEYQKALKFSQDPVVLRQAHLNLASIYLDVKIEPKTRKPDWPRKAISHLEVLLKDEPDSAIFHLWLGLAYFSAANPGGGLIELEKASGLARAKEEVWIHEKIRDFYLQIHLLDKVEKEKKIIENLNARP